MGNEPSVPRGRREVAPQPRQSGNEDVIDRNSTSLSSPEGTNPTVASWKIAPEGWILFSPTPSVKQKQKQKNSSPGSAVQDCSTPSPSGKSHSSSVVVDEFYGETDISNNRNTTVRPSPCVSVPPEESIGFSSFEAKSDEEKVIEEKNLQDLSTRTNELEDISASTSRLPADDADVAHSEGMGGKNSGQQESDIDRQSCGVHGLLEPIGGDDFEAIVSDNCSASSMDVKTTENQPNQKIFTPALFAGKDNNRHREEKNRSAALIEAASPAVLAKIRNKTYDSGPEPQAEASSEVADGSFHTQMTSLQSLGWGRKFRKRQHSYSHKILHPSQSISSVDSVTSIGTDPDHLQSSEAQKKQKLGIHGPGRRLPPSVRTSPERSDLVLSRNEGAKQGQVLFTHSVDKDGTDDTIFDRFDAYVNAEPCTVQSSVTASKKGVVPNLSVEKDNEYTVSCPSVPQQVSTDIVSTINFPKELAPYNLPGNTDYAIVLGSRLRTRNKTNVKAKYDIPYQNFSYQRRCKAVVQREDGGEGEPCKFCAVGVTNYCHYHRGLVEDSSCRETSLDGRYTNDKSQCITLILDKNRRCAKKALPGKQCCRFHGSLGVCEEAMNPPQQYNNDGTRCVAIASVRCSFRAVENSVFCPAHIRSPPNECVPIDPVDNSAIGSRNRGKPIGDGESKRLHVESRLNDEHTNAVKESSFSDLPVAVQCEHTNDFGDSCCYQAFGEGPFCRIHRKGSQVDRKGRHKTSSEYVTSERSKRVEVRQASGNEYRCLFVSGTRCQNEVLPGSLVCPLHRDFRQKSNLIFDASWLGGLAGTHHSQQTPMTDAHESSSSVLSSREDEEDSSPDATSSNQSISDDEIETEQESISSFRDSEKDVVSAPSGSSSRVYTHSDFEGLWRRAEGFIGRTTDEIEDSKLVRAANGKMEKADSGRQLKAQYGRLLPNAMKKMLRILELTRQDVFLDVGHGIGNTCLYASFCTGCDSRGIEVVANRHSVAEVFSSLLNKFNRENPLGIGKINLRLGQLEDPQHMYFLTLGVTRAYVNNFNGVFADRSTKIGQKYFLDDYIAGLFALMAPGTIMVTFHPLSLGLDRTSVNELRKRHGMKTSDNASFFEFEKVRLGKAYNTVKWTKKSGNETVIFVYKYRRTFQLEGDNAVFLCSNPECENAINEVPIQAPIRNEEGRFVMNHCVCKYSPKNLRLSMRSISGSALGDDDNLNL
jgi:hypothetical protein